MFNVNLKSYCMIMFMTFLSLWLIADTNRVETARRDSIYNDSQVVTNVDLSGLASEEYVQTVSTQTLDVANLYTDGLVVHTNSTFSNEVLAVGFGVSSNDVSVIREMVGTIGDLPVGGGVATLGGLLAALVASVVWLKTNKLTKGMTGGVPDDPNVSQLFTSANTLLTAMLPYGSVIHDSVSVTLTDGAVNALPAFASGDTPVLTVPLPAAGKTTDLIIRADCTTVCPTDLGITASGVTWRDISGDTMAVGKVYWVAIVVTPTEAEGEYDGVMSIKELKERTVTA